MRPCGKASCGPSCVLCHLPPCWRGRPTTGRPGLPAPTSPHSSFPQPVHSVWRPCQAVFAPFLACGHNEGGLGAAARRAPPRVSRADPAQGRRRQRWRGRAPASRSPHRRYQGANSVAGTSRIASRALSRRHLVVCRAFWALPPPPPPARFCTFCFLRFARSFFPSPLPPPPSWAPRPTPCWGGEILLAPLGARSACGLLRTPRAAAAPACCRAATAEARNWKAPRVRREIRSLSEKEYKCFITGGACCRVATCNCA